MLNRNAPIRRILRKDAQPDARGRSIYGKPCQRKCADVQENGVVNGEQLILSENANMNGSRGSNNNFRSASKSTTHCSQRRMVSARFAVLRTLTLDSQLIMITPVVWSVACSVGHATSPLVNFETARRLLRALSTTSPINAKHTKQPKTPSSQESMTGRAPPRLTTSGFAGSMAPGSPARCRRRHGRQIPC